MVERVVEFFNNTGTIETIVIRLPDSWIDVTVSQYCDYMTLLANKKKADETNEELGITFNDDERAIKTALFLSDMVIALTGLNSDLVYSFPARVIISIANEMHDSFISKKIKDKPINSFEFRKTTLKQLNKLQIQLDKVPFFRVQRRASLKKKILDLKHCTYILPKDIGQLSLEQWIAANKATKEIKKISDELKQDDFSRYPELLSYLFLEKGKKFNWKKQKKNTKVFKELPFETAYRASNFFLGTQLILLRSLKSFIVQTVEAEKQHQKLLKNKNT